MESVRPSKPIQTLLWRSGKHTLTPAFALSAPKAYKWLSFETNPTFTFRTRPCHPLLVKPNGRVCRKTLSVAIKNSWVLRLPSRSMKMSRYVVSLSIQGPLKSGVRLTKEGGSGRGLFMGGPQAWTRLRNSGHRREMLDHCSIKYLLSVPGWW